MGTLRQVMIIYTGVNIFARYNIILVLIYFYLSSIHPAYLWWVKSVFKLMYFSGDLVNSECIAASSTLTVFHALCFLKSIQTKSSILLHMS